MGRPRNLARPCKGDAPCDCRARGSPIPALVCVLTCVTRALRSGTRTKKQTAVSRGPKRIAFTNFLTFELKTWQALFFISQREAGRPNTGICGRTSENGDGRRCPSSELRGAVRQPVRIQHSAGNPGTYALHIASLARRPKPPNT